jgi:hypothetical protein
MTRGFRGCGGRGYRRAGAGAECGARRRRIGVGIVRWHRAAAGPPERRRRPAYAEPANGPAKPGGRREPAAGPPKAEPARGGERANRPQPQRRRGAGASECRPAERCRSGRAKPGGASEGERRAKAGVAPPPEEPPRTTAAAQPRPLRGGGRQGVGGAARGGGGASAAGRPTRPGRGPRRKAAAPGPAESLRRAQPAGRGRPGRRGRGTGGRRGSPAGSRWACRGSTDRPGVGSVAARSAPPAPPYAGVGGPTGRGRRQARLALGWGVEVRQGVPAVRALGVAEECESAK